MDIYKGLNRIFPWEIFQNLLGLMDFAWALEVLIGLFRVFSEIFRQNSCNRPKAIVLVVATEKKSSYNKVILKPLNIRVIKRFVLVLHI